AGPGLVAAKCTAERREVPSAKRASAIPRRAPTICAAVQRRIPERQPTEAQESERHGRIQMRPGPLPGRRVDEEDRSEPHGEAHQRPPLERRGYRGADGRGGMLEQHGEEARREEERAEAE